MSVKVQSLIAFIKKETVLSISFILAFLSCFLVTPDAEYTGYVDIHTILILFCLMAVMAGLKEMGLFQQIGESLLKKFQSQRGIIFVLVFLCFISSMFITNDVALITFVPLAILMLNMANMNGTACFTITLMTIAANLGSMLTPIGNPQNLYLYSVSGMPLPDFLILMLPCTLTAAVMLIVCIFFGYKSDKASLADGTAIPVTGQHAADCSFSGIIGSASKQNADNLDSLLHNTHTKSLKSVKKKEGALHILRARAGCNAAASNPRAAHFSSEASFIHVERPHKQQLPRTKATRSFLMNKKAPALNRGKLIFFLILFVLCLLCVADILSVYILFAIILIAVLIENRKLLLKIDYSLLATFICFFIFIGNMGRLPAFRNFIQMILEGRSRLVSVAISQVISNVPAALLLSGFTNEWTELIIGTNLGGLGTLIASMASLISYKQLAAQYPEKKGKYLLVFTLWNVVFLAVLYPVSFMLAF